MYQLARLLTLLTAIQAKPGIKVKELSDKCQVSTRTVYRDLETLSRTVPITSDGHGKGFRFIGRFALNPVDLNDQEAMVLSMLPTLVDRENLSPAFDSLHDKLMAHYLGEKKNPHEMYERISNLIRMGKPAYRMENPNFLSTIMQAMLESRTISTVYHTQSRNVTSERDIDPYYLVPREQRFYLIGFCRKEQKVQIFRISRFLKVELTNQKFETGSFNIEKFMQHTWSIHRGDKKTTFKVKFSANVARYIREEELFVQPLMEEQEDGGLLFKVTVNNEEEFIRWLLQYGEDAEILRQQSARELMKHRLKVWAGKY